jgi:hypothetical protein
MIIVTRLRPGKVVFAWAFVLATACCGESATSCCAGERPWIELRVDGNGGQTIRLGGLSSQQVDRLRGKLKRQSWPAFFPVRVHSESNSAVPNLLGRYELADGGAVFHPRFPLKPGLRYVARFHIDSERVDAESIVLIPVPASEPTRVVTIYPSASVLPENLLRFYVQFSAPMRQGDIYRHVRLLDSDKRPVELAFLEIEQELWSRDGTRLMLLLDPGRVKRGLKPREDAGPALVAGRSYGLWIDPSWRDANGKPLAEPADKVFRVGEPDVIQPSEKRWRIEPPRAETVAALKVVFDEPLDYAMLQRVILVTHRDGREIDGQVSLADRETRWLFVPTEKWSPGEYTLQVATTLEDVAGNSIARRFEVDISRSQPQVAVPKTVNLPFVVER